MKHPDLYHLPTPGALLPPTPETAGAGAFEASLRDLLNDNITLQAENHQLRERLTLARQMIADYHNRLCKEYGAKVADLHQRAVYGR